MPTLKVAPKKPMKKLAKTTVKSFVKPAVKKFITPLHIAEPPDVAQSRAYRVVVHMPTAPTTTTMICISYGAPVGSWRTSEPESPTNRPPSGLGAGQRR